MTHMTPVDVIAAAQDRIDELAAISLQGETVREASIEIAVKLECDNARLRDAMREANKQILEVVSWQGPGRQGTIASLNLIADALLSAVTDV